MDKGRGLFVKLEFPWINQIIFVLNNRWTRSMANKGGVREEGAKGQLLNMARERGGSLVRHGRGVKDGGARRSARGRR
jgi:hypothetical protein